MNTPLFTSPQCLYLHSLQRVGTAPGGTEAPHDPSRLEPSPTAEVEDKLLNSIILPTAKMSNDLLHLDEALLQKKLRPTDAYSYEERILLTYSQDTEEGRLKHAMRGAFVGAIAGGITAIGLVPLNVFYTNSVLEKKHKTTDLKTPKGFVSTLLFKGLQAYDKESYFPSVVKGILASIAAAAFTGMLVSENQTRTQSVQANELAQRMHTEVDKEKVSVVRLKHHAQYHQIPQDYHAWQREKTDWEKNLKAALAFNYGLSSLNLILQLMALNLVFKATLAHPKDSYKKLSSFKKMIEEKENPLFHQVLNWFDPTLVSNIMKIAAKDSEHASVELKRVFKESVNHRLTERFSPVNIARLGMVSVLTSVVMAIRNARHLALIHREVHRDMLEERKQEWTQKGVNGHYPPIPGEPNVTV